MKNLYDIGMATPKISLVLWCSAWNSYGMSEVNGIKYIVGYDSKVKDICEKDIVCNSSVLYSLLELHKKLSVKYSRIRANIYKKTTTKDIELIIAFCKKYGLPEWETQEQEHTEKENLLHYVKPLSDCAYMDIGKFIQNLHFLYCDFLTAAAVHYKDFDENNVAPFLIDQDKKTGTVPGRSETANLKFEKLRNRKYKGMLTSSVKPYKTFWNGSGLSLECENPIHAATYFLCLLYQFGKTEGVIKKCQKCGSYFVTDHPQQKFCNMPCTRYTNYNSKRKKHSSV